MNSEASGAPAMTEATHAAPTVHPPLAESGNAGGVAVLPTVAVLIVNFRTPILTQRAVQSALQDSVASEVIVVDNDCGDGSIEILKDTFGREPRVKIIHSKRNLGFGGGNNLAASYSQSELLFLLNSDAELRPGSLETLTRVWRTIPNPGILAPTVFVTATGTLQADATGVFPTATRTLLQSSKRPPDATHPDFVSGCALMISSDTFNAIGGFDEDIFMYFEDVLMCWKVRKMGLTVTVCPHAAVDHQGGGSAKSGFSTKRNYHSAQDLFLIKIGDPVWVRLAVKCLRWPVYVARIVITNIHSHFAQSTHSAKYS